VGRRGAAEVGVRRARSVWLKPAGGWLRHGASPAKVQGVVADASCADEAKLAAI
jgi:hypothetical protein